jgi:predicted TPR repeat methyltransferase
MSYFVPVFRSSGDVLADRRFAYAKAAVESDDYAEAVEILMQVLELTPHWAPALFMLGIAEDKLSHRREAIAAMEEAALLDLHDELGAALQLARLGARPSPGTAAEAYVTNLFDQYAKRFEEHLVGMLAYCGPTLLLEAVSALQPGRFSHVLDLGCGTGLCGVAFRSKADHLCGVDLSAGMIEEARGKAVYDRLEVASIDAHLAAAAPASIDLLLAADVFVYIGDVAPLFAQARRVLSADGLFAFTAQRGNEGFLIGPDLRYAHAPAYIEREARSNGLMVLTLEDAAIRRENDQDVQGLVVILKRA